MHDWEEQLDERLRQVPLPAGMLARLQQIAAGDVSLSDEELALLSDDALDDQLCAVELPGNLIDRVQQDLSSLAAAEELDARLVDVAVPSGLLKTLRQIPWQLTHRRRVERLAMAAALTLVVGLGYTTLVGSWLAAMYNRPTEEVAWIELDERPLQFAGSLTPVEVATLASSEVFDESPVTFTGPWNERLSALPVSFIDPLAPPTAVDDRGATRDVNEQFAHSDPWQDLLVMRWNVLGSPSDVNDRLPPLEALQPRRSTGVVPPMVRGFDRQFFVKERVPPVVMPEASAELRRVEIPLTTSTESLRLAWRRLREGRLPDAEEMHIADFLAAMEYPLPAAKPGEVGLRVAAGPSAFGHNGARLLQVCAQAGPLAEASRKPTHLTVALDVSASMDHGGKLEAAKRGIRQMLSHLGTNDRVSLLLFNDRDQAEIIAVSQAETRVVLRLLDQVRAAGGTNLAAGLQRGASLAMSEAATPGAARKLVLVTDGRAPMSGETQHALAELFGELRTQGLTLSVLDLSTNETPDPGLVDLANLTKGTLSHPRTPEEAQWLLTDLLLGHPSIVAPDATLRVTFRPQAVAAYRLIGHEPSPLVGLEPALVSIDLRAGQVVTGLLEVWLKPNSEEIVATAELAWLDPSSGSPRRVQQDISRLQFATTFAEAPLSLQAATIAAETGEILQGSPFVEGRNRGLADVRALAMRVNPRLADREGFRRFVSFVEAAERLRTDRVVPASE